MHSLHEEWVDRLFGVAAVQVSAGVQFGGLKLAMYWLSAVLVTASTACQWPGAAFWRSTCVPLLHPRPVSQSAAPPAVQGHARQLLSLDPTNLNYLALQREAKNLAARNDGGEADRELLQLAEQQKGGPVTGPATVGG